MVRTDPKRVLRNTSHNKRLAKVAVQCSADTFVVNHSLVLRINICGENRHLRQAPKRCVQFYRATNQRHKQRKKWEYSTNYLEVK